MDHVNSRHVAGIGLVLGAATLWSFSGLGVKVLSEMDALSITGYRSMFACPVLILAFIYSSRNGSWQDVKSMLGQKTVWASALSYAIMLMLFISSNRLTTSANAILLQYTSPLYVALLSWPILKERIRLPEWIALAVCFLGMCFFFAEKLSASGMLGNTLAVVSGVFCALNCIFLRLAARNNQSLAGENSSKAPLLAMVLGNLLTCVFCLPWMFDSYPQGAFAWSAITLLGFFQLGLAFVLFTAGIARVSAIEGVLLGLFEALLNPVWVAIAVQEFPSRMAVVGGMLIFVSLLTFGWLKQRNHLAIQ